MKKLFLTNVILLLLSSPVNAGPYLVCDPQAGVTEYRLTGPAWVPQIVTAQPDGSLKMDVAAATVGENSLNVSACNVDLVWGEGCSLHTPFSFTRPGSPSGPVNLGLSK